MESQESDLREGRQSQQLEPKPSPSTSRLIRQPNIQVPEILVTVEPDADMPSVSPPVTAPSSKVQRFPVYVPVFSTFVVSQLSLNSKLHHKGQ